MNRFVLLIGLFFSSPLFSQTVSCKEFERFIIKNGDEKGSVNNLTLTSSWLRKVTAYAYDSKIYVVAEIKDDDYGFNTRTYIFCNVPAGNWNRFKDGIYDISKSVGERFHKYIYDYQCNCK